MYCQCHQQLTFAIKVEGEVETDPIWCSHCGCNMEIEDLPVSQKLQEELAEWAIVYGKWIDWEKDILLPNALFLQEQHNKEGVLLSEKIKEEIGGAYTVHFSPSTAACG